MHITKYEHACLVIEDGKDKLVVDPGCFTKLPHDLANVGHIFITEEHVDHFNLQNIRAILAQSPKAAIYTTAVVSEQLAEDGIASITIAGKKTVEANSFTFLFEETDHAPVYKKSACRVLTVKINDFLYYPSDSFRPTKDKVKVLALPTCGPWNKLSEAIELANAVASEAILVIHNGLYNEAGNDVMNRFITMNLADQKRQWMYLKEGESAQL